jgi:hypothetical protein
VSAKSGILSPLGTHVLRIRDHSVKR